VAKLAAALVVVIALAAWAWTRHGRAVDEHRLAGVASELAGRDVQVRCQGFWSELLDIQDRAGEVQFRDGAPPDSTFLTRKTCRDLKRFRTQATHPELECLLTVDWSSWDLARDFDSPCADAARPVTQALTILAHESMHLRGFVDEAVAQCYAIQEVAWTTMRLGGTPAEGAAVASFALAQEPALPSEYQSGECRAGGALDLNPQTPAFPTEETPQPPPGRLAGTALAAG
jgi:hypothetical protein